MKITPDWLKSTSHCADGLAWGLAALPPDGLDLADCWPKIERPDFAIALAVKSGAVHYLDVRYFVGVELFQHAKTVGDKSLSLDIERFRQCLRPDQRGLFLNVFLGELASEVHLAIAIDNDDSKAHRYNALCFLVKADAAIDEGSLPLALERVQGAARCIGLSKGYRATTDSLLCRLGLCEWPEGAAV